jgi:hypothetical protein
MTVMIFIELFFSIFFIIISIFSRFMKSKEMNLGNG